MAHIQSALIIWARDAILDPVHIAQNHVSLYQQTRTAWTFQIDLRPYCETWL